jgi:hypothetical protein
MHKGSWSTAGEFGAFGSHDYLSPFTNLLRRVAFLGCLAPLLVLGGCGTTVFQSSFNSNAVNSPPSPNQATGTTVVSGATGSVVVVANPPNGTGNWVQIQRANSQGAPVSTLQCDFSQGPQNGTYGLLAVMLIPSGSGLATVEFDTSTRANPASAALGHLDFGDFKQADGSVAKNTVRINDTTMCTSCSFPRGQPFTLSASVQVGASSTTASFNLLGAGGLATGSQDVPLTPQSFANQYGELKFYMGFPWSGSFYVSDIVVTRK